MKHGIFDPTELFDPHQGSRIQAGAFLIILSSLFLLGMSGITILGYSPWIVMALLPVYWFGLAAYRSYKVDGRLTGRVLMPLAICLLPFAFVAAAMLGFNLGKLLPIILIALGASYMLSAGRR